MNCFTVFTWQTRPARAALNFGGNFSRHNQTGQKWLGWILNKQIKTQTNEQTKKKAKQNKTKAKQNKTKNEQTKQGMAIEKKKKKKKKLATLTKNGH